MPNVKRNRHLRRSIYTITCPAGIYIGCTCLPIERRIAHHYAVARTFEDGLATEAAVVEQYRRVGALILNFIPRGRLSIQEHRALWLRWLTDDDRRAVCDEYGLSEASITALCPFRKILSENRRGRPLYAALRALGHSELERRVDAALAQRAALQGISA